MLSTICVSKFVLAQNLNRWNDAELCRNNSGMQPYPYIANMIMSNWFPCSRESIDQAKVMQII